MNPTDLCTLSRIVLAGPETFYQLVLATAARSGTPEDQILSILLDSLVEKVRHLRPLTRLFPRARARDES